MYSGQFYPLGAVFACSAPPMPVQPCSSCAMQDWCMMIRASEEIECKHYRPAAGYMRRRRG